jgi:type I restriction enzyme S subunit
MAGDWETVSLSQLCEQIADCPHSTPLWTDSGVIVLRKQNIRDGRLDVSSPSYTDEAHFEQRSRRARLKAGDLVLTREAPMGEVCMIPENLRCCLGQRTVMLRPDPQKCDSRFLLYSI